MADMAKTGCWPCIPLQAFIARVDGNFGYNTSRRHMVCYLMGKTSATRRQRCDRGLIICELQPFARARARMGTRGRLWTRSSGEQAAEELNAMLWISVA